MMGMLKNVETIFGGNMTNPNKKDVKVWEDLLRKGLGDSVIATAAYHCKDMDANCIQQYTYAAGNDLVRRANSIKTRVCWWDLGESCKA